MRLPLYRAGICRLYSARRGWLSLTLTLPFIVNFADFHCWIIANSWLLPVDWECCSPNSWLIILLANCKRLHSISPSAVNFDLVLRSISFIVRLKIHRGRTPVPGFSRYPFWCLRCRCWPLDVWTAIAALLASTYAPHLGAMPFEEIDSDWTCCDFECGFTSGLGYNLFVADCLFRLPFKPLFLPSAHFVDEEHWCHAIAPFILTVQS